MGTARPIAGPVVGLPLAPPDAATSTPPVRWWIPEYARICALDSSSRIRLAGLPAPTSWEGRATDRPGVVHLWRLRAPAPGCLTIDTTGRLRLPRRLREWLSLSAHLSDATAVAAEVDVASVRQVVVVSVPPYETIALGASWVLGPLLGTPPLGRDELVLAT